MTNHAATPISFVAKLFAEHQADTHKADADMARELGLTDNVFAGIKRGQIKLPLTKAPALAQVTKLRPGYVLGEMLREVEPELLQMIQEAWRPADLTSNERQLLADYRRLAKGRDAAPVVIKGVAIIAPRAQG
jgi:hypothetical protein